MLHLDGKIAVITGATGSIGRESVNVFKREGATVVAVDVRDGETMATAIRSIRSAPATRG